MAEKKTTVTAKPAAKAVAAKAEAAKAYGDIAEGFILA